MSSQPGAVRGRCVAREERQAHSASGTSNPSTTACGRARGTFATEPGVRTAAAASAVHITAGCPRRVGQTHGAIAPCDRHERGV